MNNGLKIAIDGTAGSGKTTIAKLIAKELNIQYINTGLYYRAATFLIMENSLIGDQKKAIKILKNSSIKYIDEKSIQLNNKVLTFEQLTNPELTKNIHYIANDEEAREIIVKMLKEISNSQESLLMEGRDITTVIMKNCKNKFFISASPEIRTKRRMLQTKISDDKYEETLEFIIKRDMLDMNRKVGALKIDKDAFQIDTSIIDIESTVKLIIDNLKT